MPLLRLLNKIIMGSQELQRQLEQLHRLVLRRLVLLHRLVQVSLGSFRLALRLEEQQLQDLEVLLPEWLRRHSRL